MNGSDQSQFRKWELESAREVGITGIKTLLTVNSGGFVVLLAFIGNAQAQSQYFVPLFSIKAALTLFLVGIVLALSTLIVSYVGSAPSEGKIKNYLSSYLITYNVFLTLFSLISFAVAVLCIVFSVELSP
jgi:hypothetical protein